MPELRNARDRDAGSGTVETIVLIPVLMLVLLVAAGLGVLERARLAADDASAAAARAASLARTATTAREAARAEADRDLGAGGMPCRRRDVVLDVSGFRPGGTVKVSVSCHADLSLLPGVGWLPIQTVEQSTSVSPVDVFREAG
ncbi:hypothetical protein ABH935_004148 [Catenulispora sp. GAS73]|uniref:TadE/TadG family type IV pilus assembly protein n=1 Tax=Catenulispora sp. GAS73 TaxID=3156269 RepID=UPI003516D46B